MILYNNDITTSLCECNVYCLIDRGSQLGDILEGKNVLCSVHES